MRQKFISSLFLLMLLNFLVKPFWLLGIDRSVQNVVGAENYGIYYALFNLSFLLDVLLDFGITNFNNRDIARNHKLIGKNLIGIAYLKLGFALVYLIMSFGLAYILGYRGPFLLLLLVLAINKVLLSAILFMRSNISGLQLFKTDAVISVLDKSLMIAICAVLLWGGVANRSFQIEWLAYSQSAAYLITFIVTLIVVLRKSTNLNWSPNFSTIRAILKQSTPYALIILFMGIYYRLDGVMLERMLSNGDYEAGIYAQGYRILDALNMVGFMFVSILFPMFSKLLGNKENFKPVLNIAARLLLSFALIATISCFWFSQEIMDLLYTETDTQSGWVFRVLILCFIPISFVNIYGTLLTANGNLKAFNVIAFLGIVVNLGLNFYLIPREHALGSAIASLITNVIVSGLLYFTLTRKLPVVSNLKLSLKLLSLAVFILSFGYLFKINSSLDWYWMWFSSIFVGVLGAFALRIIGLNSVGEFIRLRR